MVSHQFDAASFTAQMPAGPEVDEVDRLASGIERDELIQSGERNEPMP